MGPDAPRLRRRVARARSARRGIRRVEQVDGMHDAHVTSRLAQAGADLHQAARIAGGDERRARLGDVRELRREHRRATSGSTRL